MHRILYLSNYQRTEQLRLDAGGKSVLIYETTEAYTRHLRPGTLPTSDLINIQINSMWGFYRKHQLEQLRGIEYSRSAYILLAEGTFKAFILAHIIRNLCTGANEKTILYYRSENHPLVTSSRFNAFTSVSSLLIASDILEVIWGHKLILKDTSEDAAENLDIDTIRYPSTIHQELVAKSKGIDIFLRSKLDMSAITDTRILIISDGYRRNYLDLIRKYLVRFKGLVDSVSPAVYLALLSPLQSSQIPKRPASSSLLSLFNGIRSSTLSCFYQQLDLGLQTWFQLAIQEIKEFDPSVIFLSDFVTAESALISEYLVAKDMDCIILGHSTNCLLAGSLAYDNDHFSTPSLPKGIRGTYLIPLQPKDECLSNMLREFPKIQVVEDPQMSINLESPSPVTSNYKTIYDSIMVACDYEPAFPYYEGECEFIVDSFIELLRSLAGYNIEICIRITSTNLSLAGSLALRLGMHINAKQIARREILLHLERPNFFVGQSNPSYVLSQGAKTFVTQYLSIRNPILVAIDSCGSIGYEFQSRKLPAICWSRDYKKDWRTNSEHLTAYYRFCGSATSVSDLVGTLLNGKNS